MATDAKTWRCFHCGEVFTTVGSARDHFGYTQFADPGCIIDKVAIEEGGKPERGRGLLMALRAAEVELARYREEDTDLHRALHAKDCEHATALRRAEEQGYARGLEDAKRHPEELGLTRAAGVCGVAHSVQSDPSVLDEKRLPAKHTPCRLCHPVTETVSWRCSGQCGTSAGSLS